MRRSSLVRLLPLIAALLLATLGCRERSGRLRVLLTTDSRGALGEAVDNGPAGGLGLRAAHLRALRQDGVPAVILDGGDLYGVVSDKARDRLAAAQVRQLSRMQYDAVAIGPNDGSLPPQSLTELMRGAGFRWLAGSWRDGRAKWGADTALVVERGGLLVGVLDWVALDPARSHVKARELDGGLLRRARAMRPHVDLLVVLASLPYSQVDSLVAPLGGLADLLLLTGRPEVSQEPRMVNGVRVVSLGLGARRIGVFDLAVEKGRWVKEAWSIREVDASLPADPTVAGDVFLALDGEESRARGRREQLRLQVLASLGLDPRLMPGESSMSRYQGDASCRACHAEQWEEWRQSPHAEVWQKLEREGDIANVERVKRSVTGWLEKSGWVNHSETPGLSGVTCEACHGRLGQHVTSKNHENRGMDPAPAAACLRCHDVVPDVDPHTLRPR